MISSIPFIALPLLAGDKYVSSAAGNSAMEAAGDIPGDILINGDFSDGDNHSFDPSGVMTAGIIDQLLAVWEQMADHYKNRSDLIYYEILNEPHDISDAVWKGMQQQVIDAIRAVDDTHTIIVSPDYWSNPTVENIEGIPYPYDAGSMPAILTSQQKG